MAKRTRGPVVGGVVGRRQHQRRKRRGPERPVTDLTAALTEGLAPLKGKGDGKEE